MTDRRAELVATGRRHGLSLATDRIDIDESGADFLVAHATDDDGARWILRSPRRDDVHDRAALEQRALRLIEGRLPVKAPRWEIYAPDLIAYRRLPGNPAATIDLEAGGYRWRFDEADPPELFMESLAATLAALHSLPIEEARAAGLPVQEPAEVRRMTAGRMDRAREVLAVPAPVWSRWQRWLDDDACWPERSTFIHGDLHPAHILVDDGHRVTGLLDWTEARVGDPAADFTLQFATLGRPALSRLLDRYRVAGGVVWPRMEDHVVESWSAYPAVIAEFAQLTGEEGHRQLGQHLVDANAAELTAS